MTSPRRRERKGSLAYLKCLTTIPLSADDGGSLLWFLSLEGKSAHDYKFIFSGFVLEERGSLCAPSGGIGKNTCYRLFLKSDPGGRRRTSAFSRKAPPCAMGLITLPRPAGGATRKFFR